VPVLEALSHLREGPVLAHVPNYGSLLSAPVKAGKELTLSPLKNTNEYYEMDYDDMQNRLGPQSKLFYLCNPQNPVGRVYTRDELLELSRLARKNNLIVVSDEVHCDLVFDRPHIPYFSVDDYTMDRSITLMGTGKTFNIAGLPFCFAIVPNETLREELKRTCYTLHRPGVFSVIAAAAAYGESREWKNALVEYLRLNRDYIEGRLRKAFPAARLTHVEGTYLQWVDFRPLGIEYPFQWLQDHANVLASDGKIFGTEGYVRLNFGTTRARLEDAMNRIEESVKRLGR
jgi:cystathionine beta-lyase